MITLHHQTPAQFAARLAKRFRKATREEKGRIATWIYDRVQAGDITPAQIRAAFNLNLTQYTAFVARIQALRSYYLAIQAEGPE